jgi:lipopolysaccharide export system protein LptA
VTACSQACAGLASALLAGAAGAVGPDLPPFGLGAFDREEPITITAEQLEASNDDGRRTLAFRRDVDVRQGPLHLSAALLEAVYVDGDTQPYSLRARGGVEIREGLRRARCEEALYDRPARSIVCHGTPAELWDGDDRLAGGSIAFDLARQSVRVDGGAEVEIHRELADVDLGEGAPDAEALERLRGRGPVTIRAAALEASDPGDERRIRFTGGVVLKQGGIELRARELEAVYPPQATQPDRLIARHDVVLTEGDREARCAHAEYRLPVRRIACEGDAVLRDREDRLSGDRIAFDFETRQVDASGNTRLSVQSTQREREAR